MHSELLGAYPWSAHDHPAAAGNLPGHRRLREQRADVHGPRARSPAAEAARLHGAGRLHARPGRGRGRRRASAARSRARSARTATSPRPSACDDGPFGKGTGGQLRYRVTLGSRTAQTVWIAVAGSDRGMADAKKELAKALADPDAQLAAKIAERDELAARSVVDLPGDRKLQEALDWGKQNLADLTQTATNLQIRFVDQGKAYPAPVHNVKRATFIGAGYPDYPWMFATDGEYTAFAAVALGQFEAIKNHLSALREVSDDLNANSGKVAHEIVTDGSVYFGANTDPGNTDESAKFPSAVALVWRWTGDDRFRDRLYDFSRARAEVRHRPSSTPTRTAGPRAWATSSATGHGRGEARQRRLLIRGLYDFADMAKAKKKTADAEVGQRPGQQAARRASTRRGGTTESTQYADSLKAGAAGPAEALDRRHADGGRADPQRRRHARPRGRRERVNRAGRARERLLQRHRPAQPRPLPHRLRGRPGRQGRGDRSTRSRRRSPPSPRATTAGSARSSSAATRTPTRSRCSSPTRCPARCRRSSPRPTRTRTSAAAGPAARCSCRPGASTGSPGR